MRRFFRPATRRPRAFRPGVHDAVVLPLEPRRVPAAVAAPSGFTATEVVSGLDAPTAMVVAPDGRLFITEQKGQVRIVQNDTLLAAPFASLPVTIQGEQGLNGIVLDPNFSQNGYVYVYYTTATAPIHNRLSRLTADGNRVVPGSERILLDLPAIDRTRPPFHNGGALHFGPDGMLYIGVGDHKIDRAPQDVTSPFGKILRVRPDGTFPADNPFDATGGWARAVYALGFRNPFTFAFQPETGRLFANDVGQASWEEVNDVVRGGNYGWPVVEGKGTNPRFRNPVHAFPHGSGPGQGCAIVGALFLPTNSPLPAAYRGQFLFGEYCDSELRLLNPSNGAVSDFISGLPASGVDLDLGPDGSILYLSRGDVNTRGAVTRIAHSTRSAPTIAEPPAAVRVGLGQPARFSVSVAGTGPFTYQWQRNGVNIPRATGSTYTLPSATLADTNATYRVIVGNAFGAVVSPAARLTVLNNRPPVARIVAPAVGATWRLGDVIRFQGTATDPETGRLRASAFTWKVDLHHDRHVHPFVAPRRGRAAGFFRIPRAPHDEGTIWYRITLTVTDRAGLSTTVSRDIHPRGAMS